MIRIKNIELTEEELSSKLVFVLEEDGIEKKVYFKTEKEYKDYLTYERCDAIVIAILNYALKHNHNIESDIPITDELLYNIENYLIPSLVKNDSCLYNININIPMASSLDNVGAIGTGISCGVDSMHVLSQMYNSKYKALNLTHLCINNVGAFDVCYSEYGIEETIKERYEIAQQIANELNLKLIKTDSNLADIFIQVHGLTHTYSSMFAVFCLQKLYKTYFYGSAGWTFNSFNLKNNSKLDCARYELLLLYCLSKQNLKIYSEGGALTRIEKIQDIANFELAQRFLHVCVKKPTNCGICGKCKRTLLELDALNLLNNFKNVFDIDYYLKNKKYYLMWLYCQHLKKELINEPTYKLKRKEFTLFLKIQAVFWGIYRLFRKNILKNLK